MSILFRLLRRFRRNRAGAVTVEFAMVALPFLAMVLAVVEGATQQYLTSTIDRATQSVAMAVRNGTLQVKTMSPEVLRANYYCPLLPSYIDCTKIYFTLQTADCRRDGNCWASAFSDYGGGKRKTPAIATGSFDVGTVGESQYLTAVYGLPVGSLIWDNSASAVINGQRVRAVVSVATWVNDPSVQFF